MASSLAQHRSLACASSRTSTRCTPAAFQPVSRCCSRKQTVCRASLSEAAQQDRRLVLAGLAALAPALLASRPALADEETAAAPFSTFLGLATPPTSYGGYGGNAVEDAKYTFEYPSNWKTEKPNKVEKGTQGIDGRVVNPRSKDQRAFVITLGRAGEDNKSFQLRDTDSTLAGFSGADYDLQDSLAGASSITKSTREGTDGTTFYEYDIDSPDYRYLASIAVKAGKVFALFVRSPVKGFKPNEDKLRHIVSTFKLL